mmetsp:Transcript_11037/g.21913  ORF Transcript_11037/g.21913 Transcript_11037/m.21913 type:complete len:298 (-) Transcript_11037:624-1517(-)
MCTVSHIHAHESGVAESLLLQQVVFRSEDKVLSVDFEGDIRVWVSRASFRAIAVDFAFDISLQNKIIDHTDGFLRSCDEGCAAVGDSSTLGTEINLVGSLLLLTKHYRSERFGVDVFEFLRIYFVDVDLLRGHPLGEFELLRVGHGVGRLSFNHDVVDRKCPVCLGTKWCEVKVLTEAGTVVVSKNEVTSLFSLIITQVEREYRILSVFAVILISGGVTLFVLWLGRQVWKLVHFDNVVENRLHIIDSNRLESETEDSSKRHLLESIGLRSQSDGLSFESVSPEFHGLIRYVTLASP